LVALERGVAADLAAAADAVSLPHATYRRDLNRMPTGTEIVDALANEAMLAIKVLVDPESQLRALRLVKADRRWLSLFASRGRVLADFERRREQLGVAP